MITEYLYWFGFIQLNTYIDLCVCKSTTELNSKTKCNKVRINKANKAIVYDVELVDGLWPYAIGLYT